MVLGLHKIIQKDVNELFALSIASNDLEITDAVIGAQANNLFA